MNEVGHILLDNFLDKICWEGNAPIKWSLLYMFCKFKQFNRISLFEDLFRTKAIS